MHDLDEYNPLIKDYETPSPLKFNIDYFLPDSKVESSQKPNPDSIIS
jgi:hypothetical protein